MNKYSLSFWSIVIGIIILIGSVTIKVITYNRKQIIPREAELVVCYGESDFAYISQIGSTYILDINMSTDIEYEGAFDSLEDAIKEADRMWNKVTPNDERRY